MKENKTDIDVTRPAGQQMGYAILEKTEIAPNVWRFLLHAPNVAAKHQPGHFVLIQESLKGERIPITIADSDKKHGTVTLVIQVVGATTKLITQKNPGDYLPTVAGPLGKPTEIKFFGRAVLVGGGVGTAVVYPLARELKQAENSVVAVIGGRSEPYLIFESELRKWCDAVYPCTDDGSYGYHGFVTNKLDELLKSEKVDAVFTAGPALMMRAVSETTREAKVLTIASLNPIMVDGTGMCGGCRVTVGGSQLFACVDGPEFDAHLVDFDELISRHLTYKEHEQQALKQLEDESARKCKIRDS